MSITMRELADKLGVSAAAVSMALNNKPGISEETRERILEQAAAEGYDMTRLSKKNKQKAGKIVFDIHRWGDFITEDTVYVHQFMEGIESILTPVGYTMQVRFVKSPLDLHLETEYEGRVVLATVLSEADLLVSEGAGIPTVYLDNGFPRMKVDTVAIDNRQGIAQAVDHLKKLGHSQIGYMASNLRLFNTNRRMASYREEMDQMGSAINPDHILSVYENGMTVYESVSAYLRRVHTPPTAFILDSSHIVYGVYQAFNDHGVVIGRDISLVTFDNFDYNAVLNPGLTSIAVNPIDMGRAAAKNLLDKLENPGRTSYHIQVGVDLIERASSTAVGR